MPLRVAKNRDIEFVYNCIKSIRGEANYSKEQFLSYFNKEVHLNCKPLRGCVIYIWSKGEQDIGVMSCNFYNIPRYLGYGCSIEEFVITKNYRGQGFASEMLSELLLGLMDDKDIRKILISTDDQNVAGRAYSKVLNELKSTNYTKIINHLKTTN